MDQCFSQKTHNPNLNHAKMGAKTSSLAANSIATSLRLFLNIASTPLQNQSIIKLQVN